MRNQLFLLASSLLLALPGCLTAGERAANCTFGDCSFTCPEGEVCSAATPEGLYFMGTALFDDNGPEGPRPTAIFGTQTVTVLASDSSSNPFDLPFGAEGLSPLTVDSTFGSEVVIRCDGPGNGYLRIFDSDTGELYDRVSLECASVTSMEAIPYDLTFSSPDAAANSDWAFYQGTSTALGFRLSGSGSRIVDESAVFSVTGDASDNGDATTWDTRSVYASSAGIASVSATMGSGELLQSDWPVVSVVDDIVRSPSVDDPHLSSTLTVGKTTVLCFRALSGSKSIAGISWSATSGGTLVVTKAAEGCFNVKGTSAGKGTLQVTADYMQKEFTFSAVGGLSAGPREASDAPRSSHLRMGERRIGARP